MVSPVRVMLTAVSADMSDPFDNVMTMFVDAGGAQTANEDEEFIQMLGVAELAKNPNG